MSEADSLINDDVHFIINDDSFAALYKRYWKEMFALSFYCIQDEEDAKECIQDIFKSIWERRDKLKINVPIANYLFRSVKLKVAEHYRKKISHEKHLGKIIPFTDQMDHSTEQTIMFNDLKSEISKLVDNLPPQCQKVYTLSREQGLHNNEIAAHLVISEKTVKNHLTKALSFLKTHLLE